MIISHRHKFIFQHSRKVAGSTITTLLNKHLGPEDLQIGSWHDSIAHGGGFNRHAMKELVTNPIVVGEAVKRTATSVSNLRRPKFMHIANEALKKPYFAKLGPNPPHAEAWRVRDFAPDAWQTYFKFSFVRNPYAQEVSDFYWRKCPARGVAFEEFLKRKLDPQRPDPEGVSISPPTNWPIYAIGDEVAVDFVGRFENLAADLAHVGAQVGIKLDLETMPRTKSERRDRGILELYTDEARRLVEELHSKELKLFGYTFDQLTA